MARTQPRSHPAHAASALRTNSGRNTRCHTGQTNSGSGLQSVIARFDRDGRMGTVFGLCWGLGLGASRVVSTHPSCHLRIPGPRGLPDHLSSILNWHACTYPQLFQHLPFPVPHIDNINQTSDLLPRTRGSLCRPRSSSTALNR